MPVFLKKHFKDKYILFGAFIVILIGTVYRANFFSKTPLTSGGFLFSAAILVCGTLVGESMSVSILNKVISPILQQSIYNAGLLSGLIDNFGRIAGSSGYTVFRKNFEIGANEYCFYWYTMMALILGAIFIINIT